MEALKERITKRDQMMARTSMSKLRHAYNTIDKSSTRTIKIKVLQENEYVSIPKAAYALLVDILQNMSQGKSVTLIPQDTQITTQQAADMLNVSRPFIVKLLEEGAIPFKKAGTHRRININDIISYGEKIKENRNHKLAFLAEQAQELNMGY